MAAPEIVYQLDRMLVHVMDHGTGRAGARDAAAAAARGRGQVRAPPRTTATAGLPASPAATWWWCGSATTTTSPPASPAPPVRCRCGRTSWPSSAPPPGLRRCPSRSPKCTSSFRQGLRVAAGLRARTSWRSRCPPARAAGEARLRVPGDAARRSRLRFALQRAQQLAARRGALMLPALVPPAACAWRTAVRLRPAAAAPPRKDPRAGAPGRSAGARHARAPGSPRHRACRPGSFTWEPPRARSSRRRTPGRRGRLRPGGRHARARAAHRAGQSAAVDRARAGAPRRKTMPPQADAMGRKALALATGDAAAQSAAWRLIADSLRAAGPQRGRSGGGAARRGLARARVRRPFPRRCAIS